MIDIDNLTERLVQRSVRSKWLLVHNKTNKALADIKRAKTLLEKAQGTLLWAEREDGVASPAVSEWGSR
jgi:hypothetical protein